MTRIGVRGFPKTELLEADDFEIDALDPWYDSPMKRRRLRSRLLAHQNLVLSFGHFFLRGEDSVDRREKARLAVEKAEYFGVQSCSILVPPSFANRASLSESLKYFFEEFESSGRCPPRVDAPFSGEFPLERIGDPLWNPSKLECRAKEWRIHGYHPTRWIRLFSDATLEKLLALMFRYRPERLLFAHSQRMIQAQDFIRRIESKKKMRLGNTTND